jgi:hypothetical protein
LRINNNETIYTMETILKVGQVYNSYGHGEVVVKTIVKLTDKMAVISETSGYGTFPQTKSIANIEKWIKTGQWEPVAITA